MSYTCFGLYESYVHHTGENQEIARNQQTDRSGGSEGGVENSVFTNPLTMDDLEHMSPEQNIELGNEEDE